MRPIAEAYKDFPILHKEHNGHRVIYLDSGATAQIPQVVVDRVVEHMTQHMVIHIVVLMFWLLKLLKHMKTLVIV